MESLNFNLAHMLWDYETWHLSMCVEILPTEFIGQRWVRLAFLGQYIKYFLIAFFPAVFFWESSWNLQLNKKKIFCYIGESLVGGYVFLFIKYIMSQN